MIKSRDVEGLSGLYVLQEVESYQVVVDMEGVSVGLSGGVGGLHKVEGYHVVGSSVGLSGGGEGLSGGWSVSVMML